MTTPAELDGMPADYIARHPAGGDGKVTITTAYPDALPVFTFAKSAGLRRELFTVLDSRAYPKNEAVLADMLKTRERIAGLLGYSSWTDFFAADKMIGTGAHIGEFIASVAATARPLAEREYAMILAEKRKVEPEAKGLTIDEMSYYKELVRRSTYDFASQSVRPYFPFERVKQGLLDTVATLFQVTFERERDIPAWAPAVEGWLVRDHTRVIGRIYLDLHPRTGKFSHAEMAPILDGVRGRQLPEAILVCNFPAPSAGDPALMTYENVVTFFHEFGHLMHHILGGQQRWAGISGLTMESDFGEAPSGMLEELIHSPQVLAGFARHYQTGEVIPKALVQRMNRASAFGRGDWVEGQLMFTAISYDLYRLPAATVDADEITREDALRYTLPTRGRLSGTSARCRPRTTPISGTRSSSSTSTSSSTPSGRSPATRRCVTGRRCWSPAVRSRRMTWCARSSGAHRTPRRSSAGSRRSSRRRPDAYASGLIVERRSVRRAASRKGSDPRSPCVSDHLGRGERIRTSYFLVPNLTAPRCVGEQF